jgi:hypothetical protein
MIIRNRYKTFTMFGLSDTTAAGVRRKCKGKEGTAAGKDCRVPDRTTELRVESRSFLKVLEDRWALILTQHVPSHGGVSIVVKNL